MYSSKHFGQFSKKRLQDNKWFVLIIFHTVNITELFLFLSLHICKFHSIDA